MGTWSKLLITISLAALLSACGTMGKKEGETGAAVEDRGADTGMTEGEDMGAASTHGMQTGTGFKGDPLDDPESPLAKRVIYFDFDKSDIRPQDRPVVEAHAGYLAGNTGASVTLEGHTDERGTREYNLALGERRAQAVERLMNILGVQPDQIRTISFGEERPAVEGHVDSAWDLNRRVEIIYRTH